MLLITVFFSGSFPLGIQSCPGHDGHGAGVQGGCIQTTPSSPAPVHTPRASGLALRQLPVTSQPTSRVRWEMSAARSVRAGEHSSFQRRWACGKQGRSRLNVELEAGGFPRSVLGGSPEVGVMQWGRGRRSAQDPELPPASRPLPPSGRSLLQQDLLLGPQASAAALQARRASCGATRHGVPSAGTGKSVPDTNSRALGAGPPVRGRLQAWSRSCPSRPVHTAAMRARWSSVPEGGAPAGILHIQGGAGGLQLFPWEAIQR